MNTGRLDFTAAAHAIEREVGFTGGNIRVFEKVGRHSFNTALALGLLPCHKLLDFGAGTLRLGYWFARYLEPGNYYAIEPKAERLEAGKRHLLGDAVIRDKAPHFHVSGKCDMTTFGVPFDFVIARSVLTRTKPGMLRRMLSEFSNCVAPSGLLCASYWPLDGAQACRLDGHIGDDMHRDEFGFVGVVKFSLRYLQETAREYGLTVGEFGISPPLNQQVWAVFRPAGDAI